MTYSLRDLLARRDDARGGPGRQARARLHEARAASEGERVLDVGCGWGAFAIHAATRHGVHVTGITLSRAAGRAAPASAPRTAGVADQVDIRVMDWRELDEASRSTRSPRSAWSSTSARVSIDAYAQRLHELLRPGGRLLNHGIARLRHGDAEAGPFSERYVFPDAAPLHLSRVQLALERAGFETDTVEGFRARLRRDAAPLGAQLRRPTSTRPSASPATSACASGGSTCAPPATASRPASRRSTRCSATGRASSDS